MNELKELLPYISVVMTLAVFYFARKKDTQEDSATITTINVTMDNIAHDMSDVKADVKALRDEARKDHDEIVLMRAKVNALGERVDEIKEQINDK